MNEEDIQVGKALLVAGPAHGGAEFGFGCRSLLLDKLLVRAQRLARPPDDLGQTLLAHEHDQRELRVAPRPVPEELVDRVLELLLTAPELALTHEEVPVLMSHEDVRLPLEVEGFGRAPAAIHGV